MNISRGHLNTIRSDMGGTALSAIGSMNSLGWCMKSLTT